MPADAIYASGMEYIPQHSRYFDPAFLRVSRTPVNFKRSFQTTPHRESGRANSLKSPFESQRSPSPEGWGSFLCNSIDHHLRPPRTGWPPSRLTAFPLIFGLQVLLDGYPRLRSASSTRAFNRPPSFRCRWGIAYRRERIAAVWRARFGCPQPG